MTVYTGCNEQLRIDAIQNEMNPFNFITDWKGDRNTIETCLPQKHAPNVLDYASGLHAAISIKLLHIYHCDLQSNHTNNEEKINRNNTQHEGKYWNNYSNVVTSLSIWFMNTRLFCVFNNNNLLSNIEHELRSFGDFHSKSIDATNKRFNNSPWPNPLNLNNQKVFFLNFDWTNQNLCVFYFADAKFSLKRN